MQYLATNVSHKPLGATATTEIKMIFSQQQVSGRKSVNDPFCMFPFNRYPAYSAPQTWSSLCQLKKEKYIYFSIVAYELPTNISSTLSCLYFRPSCKVKGHIIQSLFCCFIVTFYCCRRTKPTTGRKVIINGKCSQWDLSCILSTTASCSISFFGPVRYSICV